MLIDCCDKRDCHNLVYPNPPATLTYPTLLQVVSASGLGEILLQLQIIDASRPSRLRRSTVEPNSPKFWHRKIKNSNPAQPGKASDGGCRGQTPKPKAKRPTFRSRSGPQLILITHQQKETRDWLTGCQSELPLAALRWDSMTISMELK